MKSLIISLIVSFFTCVSVYGQLESITIDSRKISIGDTIEVYVLGADSVSFTLEVFAYGPESGKYYTEFADSTLTVRNGELAIVEAFHESNIKEYCVGVTMVDGGFPIVFMEGGDHISQYCFLKVVDGKKVIVDAMFQQYVFAPEEEKNMLALVKRRKRK